VVGLSDIPLKSNYYRTAGFVLLFGVVMLLQQKLDQRQDETSARIEELAVLPGAEYLKPALLGYHHIAADLLWLRLVQVLGKRANTPEEYEWLYHALDVITGLDLQFDYAYQVGGVVLAEYAHRVDLSNRLLEKGLPANPSVWQIPFYLGFNHFFYLQDFEKAAEYIGRASRLEGRAAYLPRLAARLYAQAGDPESALDFLAAMWKQTDDNQFKQALEIRMKEVIIERDIRALEAAVVHHARREGKRPTHLSQLVTRGVLPALPEEPFGGEYRLNRNGTIISSTHPERLQVYRPPEIRRPHEENSR
jgi:tetratricopeptide (TPR) repeat protein